VWVRQVPLGLNMKKPFQTVPVAYVFAFAEIKAAVEEFDSGECNLRDALERVRAAMVLTEAKGGAARWGAA